MKTLLAGLGLFACGVLGGCSSDPAEESTDDETTTDESSETTVEESSETTVEESETAAEESSATTVEESDATTEASITTTVEESATTVEESSATTVEESDTATEASSATTVETETTASDAGSATEETDVDSGVPEPVIDAGPVEPTSRSYRIVSVEGTLSGDGVNIVDETRTDTLALNTCTYTSAGTPEGELHTIASDDSMTISGTFSVSGTVSCPEGMATSSSAPSCTIAATDIPGALFQGSIELTGWADDEVASIAIMAPPSGIPACNYAGVVIAADPGWGIAGSATAEQFKGSEPFEVRFMGADLLTSGTNTSNVSWDFIMTVEPIE